MYSTESITGERIYKKTKMFYPVFVHVFEEFYSILFYCILGGPIVTPIVRLPNTGPRSICAGLTGL